jgi:hypothetical protein
MSVPIRIRGVLYPSIIAAARAMRSSRATIDRALDEGWIDEVGLPHRRGGRPPKPCVYRGSHYPSQSAAAKACGVSPPAVARAVAYAKANPMAERRAA